MRALLLLALLACPMVAEPPLLSLSVGVEDWGSLNYDTTIDLGAGVEWQTARHLVLGGVYYTPQSKSATSGDTYGATGTAYRLIPLDREWSVLVGAGVGWDRVTTSAWQADRTTYSVHVGLALDEADRYSRAVLVYQFPDDTEHRANYFGVAYLVRPAWSKQRVSLGFDLGASEYRVGGVEYSGVGAGVHIGYQIRLGEEE